MGWFKDKIVDNIYTPYIKPAIEFTVNPVAQADVLTGGKSSIVLDGISGGAATKYSNAVSIGSDLVEGKSITDNLMDAKDLYAQGTSVQNTYTSGGTTPFDFKLFGKDLAGQLKDVLSPKDLYDYADRKEIDNSGYTPQLNVAPPSNNAFILIIGIVAIGIFYFLKRK